MATTTLDDRAVSPVRRPWWIIPTLAGAFVVIGILMVGMLNRDRAQVLDGPAPDFTLSTFDGEEVTLSELRGKPVIINFWASWCVECDKEMTLLEQTHQKYEGEVIMLGIAYSDVEPKAREYLAQYGITYTAGQDLGSRISDAYRIKGVPETFFIDREGNVHYLKIGPIEQPELEAVIRQLLAK
jgi:cytochrome c biogenesis protein CcmG/thiol:disulfide interchange protein DsbE